MNSSEGLKPATSSLASAGAVLQTAHGDAQDQLLKRAASGQMAIGDLMASAAQYQSAGQDENALALYDQWLAHSQSPYQHVALFNRGAVLGQMRRHADAKTSYEQALSLLPEFDQARLNLGHQLEHLGQVEAALAQWQQVCEKGEQRSDALSLELRLHAINNRARLLEQQRRYAEAETCMTQSLMLKADQPDVIQHYVHIRQKQCKWPVYKPVGGLTENQLLMGTSALAMLSLSDDPALQLLAANRYIRDKVPPSTYAPLHDVNRKPGKRLKVGYLSGDFCLHAMGLLIPELLELHDRTRFEIYGFCWSREDGSAERQRLITAMDHHVRIIELSDLDAARLIASMEIDILIDLQGLSSGARPQILGHRPAPIQIGYLGLPATSAVPGVDYMIADRYVMQPEYLKFCTEQPMYVPTCYQVCDRQRKPAPAPKRSDYDLPEDKFVYCSFNNNHKFNEEVFSSWMRTLQAVPDSVLWLLGDNPVSRENLLACASQHEVAHDRLIFAPRVSPAEYLARYALADLFLDTFPYNAGATASDLLWMGTPILTRSGRTYISRMAGSLLTAVGLPELITESLADYEKLAIALGRNPARAKAYKRYLLEAGHQSKLFDVPALVRDIEAGYQQLSDKWCQRQPDQVTLS
ncbi:MAG: acetylglucosamine transferase [Burkholderiaceae bacterium]